jgi:hypothetical protein
MPACRPAARRPHAVAPQPLAPRPRLARPAAALAAVLAGIGALAAPAAAQQHAALAVARGATLPVARGATRAARFEAVAAAPDTVSMRDLARGVPIVLQLLEAGGQPIVAPVQWRIVGGDAAFTSVDRHSNADGFVQAVLGRVPWLFASPGTVTLEATAHPRGAAERVRMSFVLVRD